MITAKLKEPEKITAQVDPVVVHSGKPAEETDPTVPAWAKQPEKPTYTAEEVGAIPAAELPAAIDAALAQAKESGEFDGDDYVLTDADKEEIAGMAAELVDVPEGGDYIPVPATASVGQTIKVSTVDDSGKPTAWEAVDFPEGGGGAAEEWELLFDVEIAEEVKTIDTGFWAIPQKKILIILDTPAASANTNYTPVTVYTGDATWNRIIKFYAAPVPTTAANRSVICVETLGEGRVKVEHSVAPAYTGKGATYWIQSADCAVKSSVWNPIDNYGNAINGHITGVNVNTYGTFAVGAKMEVYGVRT